MKCKPARILMYVDVKKMLQWNGRASVKDELEYLEVSFQFSFDWSICTALWHKINEMNLYDISSWNYHKISYNNVVYNLLENELDSMFDLGTVNINIFTELMNEILSFSVNSQKKKLERLKYVEQYAKNRLNEGKNILLEVVALLGTILFGLPMIRDTIAVLRYALFDPRTELVKGISVDGMAIFIWIILIVGLCWGIGKQYWQYILFRIR